jgi:hypothetical protein
MGFLQAIVLVVPLLNFYKNLFVRIPVIPDSTQILFKRNVYLAMTQIVINVRHPFLNAQNVNPHTIYTKIYAVYNVPKAPLLTISQNLTHVLTVFKTVHLAMAALSQNALNVTLPFIL